MAQLTKRQLEFLEKHDISLGAVFDASGMSRREYRPVMKALGKDVAIGVRPCASAGHTMRTRTGHCVVCDPAVLAYQRRWRTKAFIYVAGSRSLKAVKVGLTSHVENRMFSLKYLCYAGADDWTLLGWVETENAGLREYKAQKLLSRFASPQSYSRNGQIVDCLETFACDAAQALDAVRSSAMPILSEWTNKKSFRHYLFRPVAGGRFVRRHGKRESAPAKPLAKAKPKSQPQVSEAKLNGPIRGGSKASTTKEIRPSTNNVHSQASRRRAAASATQTVFTRVSATHAESRSDAAGKAYFRGFTARCPACGRVNRIRAADADRKPICGHSECQASLVGTPSRH
jgi:hypothetical protein